MTASEATDKSYPSRRKRQRRRLKPKPEKKLSTRSILVILGVIVLVLLISLGIIAYHVGTNRSEDVVDTSASG